MVVLRSRRWKKFSSCPFTVIWSRAKIGAVAAESKAARGGRQRMTQRWNTIVHVVGRRRMMFWIVVAALFVLPLIATQVYESVRRDWAVAAWQAAEAQDEALRRPAYDRLRSIWNEA